MSKYDWNLIEQLWKDITHEALIKKENQLWLLSCYYEIMNHENKQTHTLHVQAHTGQNFHFLLVFMSISIVIMS